MTTTDQTPLQDRLARSIYGAEMPSPRYQWAALRNEAKDRRRQQAAAVLPIIAAEVRKAQADAWDEGYMEATNGNDDPLTNPYCYETGGQA